MEKVLRIGKVVLFALAIVVLGGVVYSMFTAASNKKQIEEQMARRRELEDAQLEYYKFNTAKTVTEMTSSLPATNATASFRPIGS